MTRLALAIALALVPALAHADSISKEECIDSHSRGQDAREQGKLSLARKLFLTCAQSACPTLVSGDCARFADDLARLQPSITFVARDAGGADLPDTSVYVDDALVVTRLDDGKPHDVDPGKHIVKFQSAGHDVSVTVVVGTGEKGRAVVAKFADIGAAAAAPRTEPGRPSAPVDRVTHPAGAKFLVGGGAVVLAAGVAIGVYGLSKVPSNCSVSSHQCSAAPGDPVFDDASKDIRLSNIGFVAAGVGLAAVAGGLVWYFSGSKTTHEERMAVVPWLAPGGGGLGFSGRL